MVPQQRYHYALLRLVTARQLIARLIDQSMAAPCALAICCLQFIISKYTSLATIINSNKIHLRTKERAVLPAPSRHCRLDSLHLPASPLAGTSTPGQLITVKLLTMCNTQEPPRLRKPSGMAQKKKLLRQNASVDTTYYYKMHRSTLRTTTKYSQPVVRLRHRASNRAPTNRARIWTSDCVSCPPNRPAHAVVN